MFLNILSKRTFSRYCIILSVAALLLSCDCGTIGLSAMEKKKHSKLKISTNHLFSSSGNDSASNSLRKSQESLRSSDEATSSLSARDNKSPKASPRSKSLTKSFKDLNCNSESPSSLLSTEVPTVLISSDDSDSHLHPSPRPSSH